MKPKFLKLSAIILLLNLMEAGCEKEKWNELQLTDIYCEGIVNEEIGYVNNHTGILIPSNTDIPAFVIDADEYGDVLPTKEVLFPCNLPQESFFFEGQKIMFSGSLVSWKGTGSDSIIGDAFSIPIILTKAKIKNN